MFERYLADALATHFGHIIDDFDADKVRISVWKGAVVLKDLRLKSDALEHILRKSKKNEGYEGENKEEDTDENSFPCHIAHGSIGTFELHIPWNLFHGSQAKNETGSWTWGGKVVAEEDLSMKCSVILSDVEILITPGKATKTKNDSKDDSSKKEEMLKKRRVDKEQLVQSILNSALFHKNLDIESALQDEGTNSEGNKRAQWIKNLLKRVISSLSVTIRKVHIRYEDVGDCLGFDKKRKSRQRRPFAVGITLAEFSLSTTKDGPLEDKELFTIPQIPNKKDLKSPPASTDKSRQNLFSIQHKLAAATNLSVYWDSDITKDQITHSVMSSKDRLQWGRQKGKGTGANENPFSLLNDTSDHTYIVRPISFSLHFNLVSIHDTKPPDTNEDGKHDDLQAGREQGPSIEIIPPSRAVLALPPIEINFTKDTLEDIAYIRKSVAMWQDMKTNLLSQQVYQRLTKARPPLSPSHDPAGWWRYAFEAVNTFSQITSSDRKKNKKKGWLGLVRALKLQKKYHNLYHKFDETDNSITKISMNEMLSQMEDNLTSSEIAAFRLSYVQSSQREDDNEGFKTKSSLESLVAPEKNEYSKLRKSNCNSSNGKNEVEQEQPIPFNGEEILSCRYRELLSLEMTRLLKLEQHVNHEELYRKKQNDTLHLPKEKNVTKDTTFEISIIFPSMVLRVDDVIIEKTLHNNSTNIKSRHKRKIQPVIQISSASVHKICLRNESSWDVHCTFASLEILDLMGSSRMSTNAQTSKKSDLDKLLTRKKDQNLPSASPGGDHEDKSILIGGVSHFHSATVYVRKSLDELNSETFPSVTSINIKLSPMEAVYSVDPVHALSKIFSTANTAELANDYQRFKSLASMWRAKQKRRLIEALSARENKVVINVDVAAPVLLIHEEMKCETLVLDLGRLRFFNVEDTISGGKTHNQYDDTWKVLLENVQVFSTSFLEKYGISSFREQAHQNKNIRHLVEPFSLQFIIASRIKNSDWKESTVTESLIFIKATLPRLVFNIKSSSIHLLQRICINQEVRTTQLKQLNRNPQVISKSKLAEDVPSSITDQTKQDERKTNIEFDFVAPIIALRLENDVDGRDCFKPIDKKRNISTKAAVTPIADLVIQGIGGHFVYSRASERLTEMKFDARIRALYAKDLYQRAGHEFSMLLSSQRPEDYYGNTTPLSSTWSLDKANDESKDEDVEAEVSESDLVSFHYDSRLDPSKGTNCKNTSIKFNELYVEWNPETIAAIQKTFRSSPDDEPDEPDEHVIFKDDDLNLDLMASYINDDDMQFYDAIEHEESLSSNDNDFLLSEGPTESDDESTYRHSIFRDGENNDFLSPLVRKAVAAMGVPSNSFDPDLLDDIEGDDDDSVGSYEDAAMHSPPPPLSTLSFSLSKLRMRFNKESRHRRLITAEMCGTSVLRSSKPCGGSKTIASVGNLTFTDPTSATGSTLYGQILGLKTEDDSGATSILEISHESFPRSTDNFLESHESESSVNSSSHNNSLRPSKINCDSLTVTGCDAAISFHFSPMKFVVLQQIWMEIIDYFFVGVLGDAVWGKLDVQDSVEDDCIPQHDSEEKVKADATKNNGDSQQSNQPLTGIDADGIRFLRCSIVMESPVILLPVAYRSPQYLRFAFDTIEMSNFYNGDIFTTGSSPRVQWYNNYSFSFEGLNLTSWCGTQLNVDRAFTDKPENVKEKAKRSDDFSINIRWPVGPTATTIFPKWNIHFHCNTIRLMLRRDHYALFQHILSHNIGEQSRHLDEWNALQMLPPEKLRQYKKNIMVHFGYDKKDAIPTTFNFLISLDSIICHFFYDLDNCVADLMCSKFSWSLKKVRDRISRQHLQCESITLEQKSGKREWARFETLLFPLIGKEASKCSSKREKERDDKEEKGRDPQIVYTSTSRPEGDNVKYLEVNNACIYFIYPAWMYIKSYFQNLPDPNFMGHEEVMNSVQVADRWYNIKALEGIHDIDTSGVSEADSSVEHNPFSTEREFTQTEVESIPEPGFQFRLVLVSPHIILVSDSSVPDPKESLNSCKTVTLQLSHLDFLHTNDPSNETIAKTVLVDSLEIITGHPNRGSPIQEHSLLYPLCLCGGTKVQEIGNQDKGSGISKSSKWISTDVISARAAYTDMVLAIDVAQKVVADFQLGLESTTMLSSKSDESNETELSQSITPSLSDSTVQDERGNESIAVACGGFDLLIIDDSGRHFASAQKLIQMSLSGIQFNQSSTIKDIQNGIECTTQLHLNQIELHDILQRSTSPFRILATGNQIGGPESSSKMSKKSKSGKRMRWKRMNYILFDDLVTWDKYGMYQGAWGYSPSPAMLGRYKTASKLKEPNQINIPNLIEIKHTSFLDSGNQYLIKIRALAIQWNPSTAIALQRFLGRLRKEVRVQRAATKGDSAKAMAQTNISSTEEYLPNIDNIEETNQSRQDPNILKNSSVTAKVEIDSLTICLNKEDQHRRLLQVTIAKSEVNFARDQLGQLNLDGFIGDLNAWDSDVYRDAQTPLHESNRLVLSIANNGGVESIRKRRYHSKRLMTFKYHSQPQRNEMNDYLVLSKRSLPSWVQSLVGKDIAAECIDDILSLEVATIRLNYIKERTAEIIDYLSNGIPGKGMGATSQAAKGFINKRIKTRSFLNLSIEAPEIVLPRNRGSDDGVYLCLGDVRLKSWFEEATIDESEAIDCDQLTEEVQFKLSPSYSMSSTKSTFSESFESQRKHWWRVLSISILGIGWRKRSIKRIISDSSSEDEQPINLHLLLRKPPSPDICAMIGRCRLSHVEWNLNYTEYAMLRSVLKDNLTKDLDMSSWGTVDETFSTEDNDLSEDEDYESSENRVKYSKSARFIRYGTMVQKTNKVHVAPSHFPPDPESDEVSVIENNGKTPIDFKLQLDGFNLTLHRDDVIKGCTDLEKSKEFNYDMVLFRVKKVMSSLAIDESGDKLASINFYQLGLFDIGDVKRLAREKYVRKLNMQEKPGKLRKSSAFSVIVDGYKLSEGSEQSLRVGEDNGEHGIDPQLTITVRTCPSSAVGLESSSLDSKDSQVTIVHVLINCMNINPLIRPLKEVADFLSCTWSGSKNERLDTIDKAENEGNTNTEKNQQKESGSDLVDKNHHRTSGILVEVVAHYPRVFLLADESDPSTRALVLRGLAIVNGRIISEEKSSIPAAVSDDKRIAYLKDIRSQTSIEADFQSLESYINPNVQSALGYGTSIVDELNPCQSDEIDHDLLGVALIEPVTAGFEFSQEKRERFPTIRTIYAHMEPVSTTFSFDDILLIQNLLSRWNDEKKWSKGEKTISKGDEKITDVNVPSRELIIDESISEEGATKNEEKSEDGISFSVAETIEVSTSYEENMTSSACCGDCVAFPSFPDMSQSLGASTTRVLHSNDNHYDVTFHREKLGLILRKAGSRILVDSVTLNDLTSQVHSGDEILSIGETNVIGKSLQSIIDVLHVSPRPTVITFKREELNEEDSVSSLNEDAPNRANVIEPPSSVSDHYESNFSTTRSFESVGDIKTKPSIINFKNKIIPTTLSFHVGMNIGLELERSVCGDIAVVANLDHVIYEASLVKSDPTQDLYIPRPGAVILAVNGRPAHEIGYEGTIEFLLSMSNTDELEKTFSVSFIEPSSDDWGAVEKVDIIIYGIRVTLIDDINGRDMPLMRGSLNAIAFKLERGLGLDCCSIKVAPPSLLLCPIALGSCPGSDLGETDATYEKKYTVSDLSEVILKICGGLEIGLDYYNARIAAWEPLIELCHLNGELEYQRGSQGPSPRPGVISIAISDCEAVLENDSLEQNLVSINITDAAAELLISTMYEWKFWQKRFNNGVVEHGNERLITGGDGSNLNPDESKSSSNVFTESTAKFGQDELKGSMALTKGGGRAATQNAAAQAALIFAKRRGADSQKSNEVKPFIFRNKTGMRITFVPQTRSNASTTSFEDSNDETYGRAASFDLRAFKSTATKAIEDGEEARFSMDPIGSDEFDTLDNNGEQNRSGKRIRSYDGQFPFLSVALQPSQDSTDIEVLRDMSVVKIGQSLRRLYMRKGTSRKKSNSFETAFLLVVWSVELENNRRIITLSSAVNIIAQECGIPIEIGVRQHPPELKESLKVASVFEDYIKDSNKIQRIGISTPSNPCYLPLWLDISFQRAEIFVRPATTLEGENTYEWSSKSLLKFDKIDSANLEGTGFNSMWMWKLSDSTCQLRCNVDKRSAKRGKEKTFLPAWLSWSRTEMNKIARESILPDAVKNENRNETICISIFSGVSLRNCLPVDVEWEIGSTLEYNPLSSENTKILDGSSLRKQQSLWLGQERNDNEDAQILRSGCTTDVFCCDTLSMIAKIRFRFESKKDWTSWALINAQNIVEGQEESDTSKEASMKIRQVNIASKYDKDSPSSIGLKIIPKISVSIRGSQEIQTVTGFELAIFSELWLCNLTSLPIVFGAPFSQIYGSENRATTASSKDIESGGRLAAEAALMEISSLLEFGDRGMSRENEISCATGDILSLPKQQSNEVVEEVFEYTEMENGKVKRRWWASEEHSIEMCEPASNISLDHTEWGWADYQWKIDIATQTNESPEGWESCLNLVGGKGRSFSGQRTFNARHPFRRRRWFRRKVKLQPKQFNQPKIGNQSTPFLVEPQGIGNMVFHHPIIDSRKSASMGSERMTDEVESKNRGSFIDAVSTDLSEDDSFRVHFKIGDGRWSQPVTIPMQGASHGVVRVFASRWEHITNTVSSYGFSRSTPKSALSSDALGRDKQPEFSSGCLNPCCYELSYQVLAVEGPWGELSRFLLLHPRFFIRNDSDKFPMELKQSGAPDHTSIRINCGQVLPFYWADTRLPELVCVRPIVSRVKTKKRGNGVQKEKVYKWSGGFDICSLGMIPLRVRKYRVEEKAQRRHGSNRTKKRLPSIHVIKTMIEIRSGTGGTGIVVSFKEELPNGEDSLYRIENHSPFSLWVAQDGVLANPSHAENIFSPIKKNGSNLTTINESSDNEAGPLYLDSQSSGDLISPMQHISFGLDIPFRQGKYAGRSAASIEELLRIRVGLAPLVTRDGVESTKVAGLSYLEETIFLKPTSLRSCIQEEIRQNISRVRVQGIVYSDGPTRVLRFSLIKKGERSVFSNPANLYSVPPPLLTDNSEWRLRIKSAVQKTERLLQTNSIPNIWDEKNTNNSFKNGSKSITTSPFDSQTTVGSCHYSIRASFSGFTFSLIDAVPTEIAVLSLQKVQVMAEWDDSRSEDTTAACSIGWIQIDNHCPNSPFPIALRPKKSDDYENDTNENESSPFLRVGLILAPRHKSRIMCLKGVTIEAARDVHIATDLSFIFRLQYFLLGLQEYVADSTNQPEAKEGWASPDLRKVFKRITASNTGAIEKQKLYFEGLKILPSNIRLSVAPTVALTSAQATLEGNEAAALHAAVRKGDVLIDNGNGVLGVKIGSKNHTVISVVRGIFKSILVDGLLRCDGASMYFPGVVVRNIISTGPQLKTYLGAHYLTSLKSNVPALLGSLAAFGNPVGLIRGFGDGVSDFVNEPVKGLRRSVQELDPTYIVNGVARGTGSLARHTVGGIVDSASLLTETFSKNMAVLTLDRKYAQRRDRFKTLPGTSTTFVEGVESGMEKLFRGVAEGVIGVVRAPMRGAERTGVKGLAKGIGKGLLGLVVKPVIGLSDAATDFMVGVKGAIEAGGTINRAEQRQMRPRRAFYGRDRILRPYELADAVSVAYMMQTRLAGENYLSHCDMGGRVAILSVRKFLLLGEDREEQLLIKLRQIRNVEVRRIPQSNGNGFEWAVLIFLKFERKNGSEVEVITIEDRNIAMDLCAKIKHGVESRCV